MAIENTSKYNLYQKYQSNDSGETWFPLNEYGYTLLEEKSETCGYMYKAILTHTDGSVSKVEDNGSSILTRGEIVSCGIEDNSIVSAVINNNVITIGAGAFSNCNVLTSVTISDSVTRIEDSAFAGCTGLTSVTIPDSVSYIGEDAFFHCYNLTSLTLGDGLYTIDKGAFIVCYNLSSVTIPDSVRYIEDSAFDMCSGLTSVTIGTGVTSIGDYAFRYCTGLTEVTIPSGSIGDYAFAECYSLTSATFGSGVTSIGTHIFVQDYDYGQASGLTAITSNATTAPTIQNGTFYDVQTGGTLYYPSGSDYSMWLSDDSYYLGYYGWNKNEKAILTLNDSSTVVLHFLWGSTAISSGEISTYKNTVVSVVIGNGVTNIGSNAFEGCTGLTSVTIPDSVTHIGTQAFQNCSGLTEVTIPNSVTSITDSAFSNCSGLTSITIPDNVGYIGSYAFENCSSLASVTIGSGVTSIENYLIFSNCSSLSSITCNATTAPTISAYTFRFINTGGTLYYPSGSNYSSWLSTGDFYLGKYGWTGQQI